MRVSSVPGCSWRKCTSSIKALIRKMPRPEPRRIFSGARGSGTVSGSRPGPWSAIRTMSESEFASNEAVMCFVGSYALPCRTALTAASRTAIAMFGTVSSSKPARAAKSSAVLSTTSTLSMVDPSVRDARLVVESGNLILWWDARRHPGHTEAMMAVCLRISRMSRCLGDFRPRWLSMWVTGVANRFRAGNSAACWDRIRIRDRYG